MKLLMENWRKYLTEEEEEYSITPEQNQALKGLYIIISRSIYDHLNQWAQEKGYDPADRSFKWKISKEYEPAPGITKDRNKLRFDVSKFQEALPQLADDFYIHFLMDPSADSSNAELRDIDGKITDLSLALKNFSNPMQIKQSIQHELQHIIEKGSTNVGGIEGIINYLSNAGEVNAHAKEAAYYFHKTFPEEDQFDIEKIKEGVKKNFTNYYNFATKASDIAQRKNLDPSYEQKMKKAGEQFIKYATYYLPLFKRRDQ
jgi:hypothetical protein